MCNDDSSLDPATKTPDPPPAEEVGYGEKFREMLDHALFGNLVFVRFLFR